ncbi:PAS domain-containing protein [Methanolapillus millepedarum]|uniref:PAC domain-containing protein n=1 Tax=Methanolapillus millepedarum TaxID=3028296 RepID=A0AA96V4P5_9EURY|nr:hypothetical protein MsAc7_12640 [Methanosarcinaceae archaeon Ac7]
MKLQYKVIILSVLIGFLFLLAESFSRLVADSDPPITILDFLFSPLTTNENIFFSVSVLLLCLVFGILLAHVTSRILKAKEIIQEQDVQRNTTLNAIPEILVYFDKNKEIQWGNPAFYKELNILAKNLIGKKMNDLQYDFFPQEVIEEALRFGEKRSIEIRTENGRYWYVTVNPAKDNLGAGIGCVLMAIDITNEKIAEEARRKSYMQIESNIEQFATIVDNIRNPLTSIVLLTEQVADKNVAGQISAECDRIEDVISELDSGWESSEEIKNFLKKHT